MRQIRVGTQSAACFSSSVRTSGPRPFRATASVGSFSYITPPSSSFSIPPSSTTLPSTSSSPRNLRYFSSSSPSSNQNSSHLGTSSKMASATSFYDFKPLDKKGQEVDFADYKGKVVLIVNTASKCGFTPQYAGLETVYKAVSEKHPGEFVALGFPCNQFGGQEPGSDEEIQNFCQINYGVSFPIMGKIDVNGDKAAPLYDWLKKEKPGIMGLQRIKWNFEKFLIGKDGTIKGRWASTTKPESIQADILKELEKE